MSSYVCPNCPHRVVHGSSYCMSHKLSHELFRAITMAEVDRIHQLLPQATVSQRHDALVQAFQFTREVAVVAVLLPPVVPPPILLIYLLNTTVPQRDIVELLLDRGAQVNFRDGADRTPLLILLQSWRIYPDEDLVPLLVDHGADVNFRQTVTGTTPLIAAAQSGADEAVDFLVRHGAQLNAVDAQHYTALQNALDHPTGPAYRVVQAIMVLLHHGATVSSSDLIRIYHLAVDEARLEDVAALLTRWHVPVNAPLPRGGTALFIAAELGDSELVRLLVRHGANVFVRDGQGLTALEVARGPQIQQFLRHHMAQRRVLPLLAEALRANNVAPAPEAPLEAVAPAAPLEAGREAVTQEVVAQNAVARAGQNPIFDPNALRDVLGFMGVRE